MSNKIKICSLNCQGLGDHNKRRDVINFLRKSNYSIICLQDTHFVKRNERLIRNEWGYKVIFNSYDSRSRGVAIFFNNNFEFNITDTYTDNTGNFIIICLEVDSRKLVLVNIYGPNKDDPGFYKNILKIITKFNYSDIIMVGDWNLLLNPEIDGLNYKHVNNPNARNYVLQFINVLSLYDIWREEHLEEKKYTWKRKLNDGILQMGRLDFFLISESIISFCSNENILPGYRSDHSLIEITLNFDKNNVKNKTFWKFNNSLLYNQDFVSEIENNFLRCKEQYGAFPYDRNNIASIENKDFVSTINPQLFLEIMLLNSRSLSISFSSALKKKEESEIQQLENKIKELENVDIVQNFETINVLKKELQDYRENKLKGSLIRSKTKWVEQGEKPSKYFCNLENRNFVSKRMAGLIDNNGVELKTNDLISNEVYSFYKKLYSTQEHNLEDVDLSKRLNKETNKLSDFQAASLEGLMTYEEISSTLKNMQNSKSPGSTGFTTEFFKFFWKDLGYFVLKSINYGFEISELSVTQKEGIITCIPKPGKSKKYIKNWRPISLLNVTYKIASGSVANRIKKILPFLIDTDQCGFMSGRFTGDNIRLIYDVFNYANENNKKGLMLLIDFEKAFDTVAWSFIEKCLKFLNFKEDIINWIKTFYKNIKSTIIVNNAPTKWFTIERGCRQGDPISPYIFLICAEILAHMIRQDNEIKGYTVVDSEIKISQYADDTTLFLDGSEEGFNKCVHVILEYAKYSGLAMNFDKTKVIWFGCPRPPDDVYLTHFKFEWNPPKFDILGVEFTTDLTNITDKNIEKKKLF